MANKTVSVTIFFYAFVVLACFLTVCLARPDVDHGNLVEFLKPNIPKKTLPQSPSSSNPSEGLQCAELYSVKKGDTCYAVYTMMNMTPKDFFGINPNVNCHNLFVGQWLCTAAVGGK